MRIRIRVQPGVSNAIVRGRYGDDEPPVLIVRVNAPPVDGKANEAVVEALAKAFGVRRSAVALVNGSTSRLKTFDIEGADPDVHTALLQDR